MRALVAVVALALAGPARADQAVPDGVAPSGRAAWVGRCAERLERARDEAARRDPRFRGATVEATAIEAAEPGDPTAKGVRDQVELRLGLGPRRALGALVVDRLDATPAGNRGWTTPSPTAPWLGPGVHDLQLLVSREQGRRVGFLFADRVPPSTVKLLHAYLCLAVDDCLAMRAAR